MTPDDLYALVERYLPPLTVALLALAAALSSLIHAARKRRPHVVALAVGATNIAAVYLWTYLGGLSVTERAGGIRVAIVMMLLSILIYNESAWPYLSCHLHRTLTQLRGRIEWKKH